jgi:hypothetical protein
MATLARYESRHIVSDPAASRLSTAVSTFLGVVFWHPSLTPVSPSPPTPLFPASGPATGSFNGLYPKSKFLES